MKRIATLLALIPGAALAHGGHAPVHEAAHGFTHALPAMIGVLGIGLAVLWWKGRQS